MLKYYHHSWLYIINRVRRGHGVALAGRSRHHRPSVSSFMPLSCRRMKCRRAVVHARHLIRALRLIIFIWLFVMKSVMPHLKETAMRLYQRHAILCRNGLAHNEQSALMISRVSWWRLFLSWQAMPESEGNQPVCALYLLLAAKQSGRQECIN